MACNIGRAELRFGRATAAAEFLSRCVKLAPPPSTSSRDQRLAEQLAELAQARGQVVALTVHVKEPGARIAVDGALVGTSPLAEEVFVEPGLHRVSAELDGFSAATDVIEAKAGEARAVRLSLTKLARPSSPLASTQASLTPTSRALELSRTSDPNLWIALGGGVAAGVGFGLGVGTTLGSNAAALLKDEHRREILVGSKGDCGAGSWVAACEPYRAAELREQELRAVAVTSFVIASAAALGTAVYVLVPRAPVAPVVGLNGVSVVGRW
jgi:hypothetical protein